MDSGVAACLPCRHNSYFHSLHIASNYHWISNNSLSDTPLGKYHESCRFWNPSCNRDKTLSFLLKEPCEIFSRHRAGENRLKTGGSTYPKTVFFPVLIHPYPNPGNPFEQGRTTMVQILLFTASLAATARVQAPKPLSPGRNEQKTGRTCSRCCTSVRSRCRSSCTGRRRSSY